MPRQKKRRAKPRVKKLRTVSSAGKIYYQAGREPFNARKILQQHEDELKRRVRQGAVKALDAAERDPQGFWDDIERGVRGLGHIYAAFQRDPEAKRKVRNAFISALATATKRKLA